MAATDAEERADQVLRRLAATGVVDGTVTTAEAAIDADAEASGVETTADEADDLETHGTAWGAAVSSFCFFASGALVPVLPYLFGLTGTVAVVVAAVLVGICLAVTGAVTGLLSGTSPVSRAVRQLAIGFGAAGTTYVLGLVFGTSVA